MIFFAFLHHFFLTFTELRSFTNPRTRKTSNKLQINKLIMNVFEPANITAFFEVTGQMGLSNRTCLAIAAEGIVTPDNLAEFTKDGLDSVFHNLRKAPKTVIPAVNGAPVKYHAGILTEVQPCVVFVKSKM